MGRPLPHGEVSRKLVHAAMGLFALLLPFLTWQQAALCAVAAFLHNWLILPRLLGHRLTSERPGVSDRGVLLYPLVVLAAILVFRGELAVAAFVWGVLAFGDSAAGIVGQKWGAHPLPWNTRKSWEGAVAFTAAGAVGGALLAAWTTAPALHAAPTGAPRIPLGLGEVQASVTALSLAPRLALLGLVGVLAAAVLESLPHGLDDNVLPPIAAGFLFAVAWLWAGTGAGSVSVLGVLAVNTLCALIAALTRALRAGGIVVAWLLGVATALAFGWQGFALLLAFLILGLGVTFLGYSRKRAAGTAERRGGRRGAAEVLGKGGVLLVVAVQVLISGAHCQLGLGWLVVAILAAATADTWATEIGGLWGKRAFTLWPVREAAPGTPGAVSIPGLIGSLLGAAFISLLAAPLGLLGPSGLAVAATCTLAAFVAAVVESLLPRLGDASHAGRNLVVTVLAALLVYAALGGIR